MRARQHHNHRTVGIMGVGVVLLLLVSACALLNQPPKPSINIANGSPYGTAPLTITFDISESRDPDGEIVSFAFDFGDGTDPVSQGTDLSQPIKHTYEHVGQCLASLTVVDNTGEERRMQAPIILSEPAD